MLSFTEIQTLYGDLSQNASTANLARGAKLANIEHRYLLQKYYSNEGSFTDLTNAQQQHYRMPPNYSKLKTITITVGDLQWTLDEIQSRREWDQLNVFPYYSDIPSNYFIYPGGDHGTGQIGIWPIPSSSSNTITFNYKYRIPDLSIADYATGTVSITNGDLTVTGSGTTFTTTTTPDSESRWVKIAQPLGDNLWYQVEQVSDASTLNLYAAYQGSDVSGGSYILGQMPLIPEDFQDMLVWRPLMYYFSSIVPDKLKYSEFKEAYDEKLKLLAEYSGQNTVSVNLARRPQYKNPNLYGQTFG